MMNGGECSSEDSRIRNDIRRIEFGFWRRVRTFHWRFLSVVVVQ